MIGVHTYIYTNIDLFPKTLEVHLFWDGGVAVCRLLRPGLYPNPFVLDVRVLHDTPASQLVHSPTPRCSSTSGRRCHRGFALMRPNPRQANDHTCGCQNLAPLLAWPAGAPSTAFWPVVYLNPATCW